MKICNLRRHIARKILSILFAAGVFIAGATAHAQINHFVGDASFDDTPVGSGGFAYFNGPPDTAWSSSGSWWYNTDYATTDARRPDPRTGDQACHGYGSYNWQAISDTFVAGHTYTLSVYVAGDSDAVDTSDSVWLYFYDGDNPPDLDTTFFDPDSKAAWRYDFDGTTEVASGATGAGTPTNPGWGRTEAGAWGQISLEYTATAADAGQPVGIAFYGRGDAAFDDVTLTSVVPEPQSILLIGLGMAGMCSLLRRQS